MPATIAPTVAADKEVPLPEECCVFEGDADAEDEADLDAEGEGEMLADAEGLTEGVLLGMTGANAISV